MTKPRRTRTPRSRSPLLRVLGYGGASLLVVAAVAVLLMPLFGDEQGRAGTSGPVAGPGATGPQATPSGTRGVNQQSVRTRSPATPQDPTQGDQGSQGNQGANPGSGGPVLPGSGGAVTAPPCSRSAAVYQMAGTTLRVTVRLAGGGFANAEVFLQGQDSVAHNIKATDDKPRSIDFKNLRGGVERVKMSLISAGAGAQTCDARLIS